MVLRALRLAALLGVLAAPGAGEEAPALPLDLVMAVEPTAMRPVARPEARPDSGDRRCSEDGRACIGLSTYEADVCRAIETAAKAVALDVGFFARLLWRESLFDARAVSPAGAQGIAQFMPATAARRHLADPFNPAEAILASADYLKDLERQFGNLGLAAAAYNAGEERVAEYMAGARGLPGETRAYVLAITGHIPEVWRDGGAPEADLALDPRLPFQEACLAKAEGRGIPAFGVELMPWGVFLAGRDSREAAEREARGLVASHPVLAGERIDYVHESFPGMREPRHFAQVGRASRADADDLCARLRAEGAGCIVRRN